MPDTSPAMASEMQRMRDTIARLQTRVDKQNVPSADERRAQSERDRERFRQQQQQQLQTTSIKGSGRARAEKRQFTPANRQRNNDRDRDARDDRRDKRYRP